MSVVILCSTQQLRSCGDETLVSLVEKTVEAIYLSEWVAKKLFFRNDT